MSVHHVTWLDFTTCNTPLPGTEHTICPIVRVSQLDNNCQNREYHIEVTFSGVDGDAKLHQLPEEHTDIVHFVSWLLAGTNS